MRYRSGFAIALLLVSGAVVLPTVVSAGLASHELLVLVNSRSPRSMEVANHFIHLRRVPPKNVVYLDLPDRVLEPRAEISPADFTRYIWEPVQDVLVERELDEQILAWIYSVDFPVRILTHPPVSLMGMTFLRNRFPNDPEQVDKGLYLSPFFAGPDREGGKMTVGGSLIRYREEIGPKMPVPSMMLGFTGARGTDTETVIRTLRYGQAADRSSPRGTVYWVSGDDVRARVREWQVPIADRELNQMGIRTETLSHNPRDLPGILGLQMGTQGFNILGAGRHLPGSMAEHLTSYAGVFHIMSQDKLTDWIRAGATASAGTVTEPYAVWTKFPNARFYSHYARGNTMLESFYLSIRSPTQILLVGEPLARPWSLPLSLTLISLEDGPLAGEAAFAIAVFPEIPNLRLTYHVMLNGQKASESPGDTSFSFDSRDIGDGWHELRTVSYAPGAMAQTAMNRLWIEVDNVGRAVRITQPGNQTDWDLYGPLVIEAEADGEPERLELVHNGRVLERTEGATAQFMLAPERVGAGPVMLQVRAQYADEMTVYSEPWDLRIERKTPHPDLRDAAARAEAALRIEPAREKIAADRGRLSDFGERGILFAPASGDDFNVALFEERPDTVYRMSVAMTVAVPQGGHPREELAGLVFNYQDAKHFDFFGLRGPRSAWSFARVRRGELDYVVERGALALRGETHQLDLVFDGDTVKAFIGGRPISSWTDASIGDGGRLGVLAAVQPIQFERIQVEGRSEEGGVNENE